MGIQTLPQTTVRALGATQVLTDPAALVKELIDNGLDANATSIAIEIHSNTLNTIQVRDNGHGIAPEDRALLARRYCTSKISHDGDLKYIGGSSLGFRGEALASAAELSGSMTVSTRIEGEQMASALTINQQGEVTGQDRASLPVGTTVRISDFIKGHPVRKQVALKNAETCLQKIKRMLHAYSFARPHVRFSLRTLKAKNSKGDWIYAPKAGGNAEDAAFKIVGAACASQCSSFVAEDNGFTLHAFLPRADADAAKISNIGAFLSIDARPVSSMRGTFKQLVKAFREILKKTDPKFDDLKDPFLFLEISCPKGTYDANVEPAKDDVLFEDSHMVVEMATKLFIAVYCPSSATESDDSHDRIQPHPYDPATKDHDDLTLLEESTLEENATGIDEQRLDESANPRSNMGSPNPDAGDSTRFVAHPQGFRSTMYGCDEEDMELIGTRASPERQVLEAEELRQVRKDVTISNPWVLAKLNTPAQHARKSPQHRSSTVLQNHDEVLSSPTKEMPRVPTTANEAGLLTPQPSSPWRLSASLHPSDHVPNLRMARDGQLIEVSNLPVLKPIPTNPSMDTAEVGIGTGSHSQQPLPAVKDRGLISDNANTSSRTSPEAVPEGANALHGLRKRIRPSHLNKPFIPPTRGQPQRQKVWFDHLENIEKPRRSARNRRRDQGDDGLVSQGELGDLTEDARPLTPPRRNHDIRDFGDRHRTDGFAAMIEGRNSKRTTRAATASDEIANGQGILPLPKQGKLDGLGFIPASELAALKVRTSSSGKSSHVFKKRRPSERHVLVELGVNVSFDADATKDGDYRPEDIGRAPVRQRSSNRVGRSKSLRLPLERIPTGHGMHNVVYRASVTNRELSRLTQKTDVEGRLRGYNDPAHEQSSIFTLASFDLQELANNVHDLLTKAGSDTDAPGPEYLFNALSAAFSQYAGIPRM